HGELLVSPVAPVLAAFRPRGDRGRALRLRVDRQKLAALEETFVRCAADPTTSSTCSPLLNPLDTPSHLSVFTPARATAPSRRQLEVRVGPLPGLSIVDAGP